MPLSDLTSDQLSHVLRLLRERESLQGKLAKVDQALAKLDGSLSPASKALRPRRAVKISRRSPILKDSILKVLLQAGTAGLSVKEISKNAKAKHGSVSVWIYTAGKKVAGLKKIAPGRYSYSKS
jgi:hypothetical protein